MTFDRRSLLTYLGTAAVVPTVHAAQRKSLADPLRLGVEMALIESGMAAQFQKGFGRDTGVAVQLVPGLSVPLLESLERGEIDASLTNAPAIELKLEKQGLAHDRRPMASGDFLLVGPVEGKGKKAKDPAGVLGERDIAIALNRIYMAQARFISPPVGSGAYLGMLSLWQAAKVAPAAPWYSEGKGNNVLDQAAGDGAYTLVDRGLWLARGRKPLSIVLEGDARMATQVHLMRSFRVNHPAAKLFAQWVMGRQGQRVAGSLRGWKPAPR